MTIQRNDFEGHAIHFANLGENVAPFANAIPALPQHRNLYDLLFKRLIDTLLVLIALPIVLPVVLILSVLIARDGRNPFYFQKRIGRNGRNFTMWKLRTMVPNADQLLEQHLRTNSAARKEWDEKQKLANDPRITRFGRLLRKSSLDELPQLWNVLTGEMSLVGPRPMMVDQRDLYPGKDYYALRPGVTGYWQISCRNQSTFAERAQFDSKYYRDMSLSTDAHVLARTIRVVLRATGW